MFDRLGHLTFRRRRRVLALAAAFLAVAALWGTGVFGAMTSSGFDTPGSESARALARIEDTVGRAGADVVVLYRDEGRTSTTRPSGPPCEEHLAGLPPRPGRRDHHDLDGGSGRRAARVRGPALDLRRRAARRHRRRRADGRPTRSSSRRCATPRPGWTCSSAATRRSPATSPPRSSEDIARAEQLSLPIVLVLLVVIFGGLTAASLPLAIGGLAILGAFTMLRLLTLVTDVSIFAVNIVTMLGLGLAIDYALFVVSRFREELRLPGATTEDALVRTMAHRRPHRRVLRPHGRDLAGLPAAVPAGVPAVDGLRRDGSGAGRHGRRPHRAARRCSRCSATGSTRCGIPFLPRRRRRRGRRTRRTARRLVPARPQRDAPAGRLRRGDRAAAARGRHAVPAGGVRRRRPPGPARGHREPGRRRVVADATSRAAARPPSTPVVTFADGTVSVPTGRRCAAYVDRLARAARRDRSAEVTASEGGAPRWCRVRHGFEGLSAPGARAGRRGPCGPGAGRRRGAGRRPGGRPARPAGQPRRHAALDGAVRGRRHPGAAVPRVRLGGAAAQGGRDERAVAVGVLRRAGLDLPGRPPVRRCSASPRPGRSRPPSRS